MAEEEGLISVSGLFHAGAGYTLIKGLHPMDNGLIPFESDQRIIVLINPQLFQFVPGRWPVQGHGHPSSGGIIVTRAVQLTVIVFYPPVMILNQVVILGRVFEQLNLARGLF